MPITSLPPGLPSQLPVDQSAARPAVVVSPEVAKAITTLIDLIENYDLGGLEEFLAKVESPETRKIFEQLTYNDNGNPVALYEDGNTPLHMAADLSRFAHDDADWVEEHPGIEEGKARVGGHEIVGIMLKNLTSDAVHVKNDAGQTPLMLAAKNGNESTVSALLAAGAYPTDTDNKGWTALFFAAFSGAVDTIKSILSFGYLSSAKNEDKTINQRDLLGNTALMIAVENGNLAAAKMLLEAGADINAKNEDGRTALILAAIDGPSAEQMVVMLLEAGADVYVKDKDGQEALDYANAVDAPQPPVDALFV